MFEGGAANGWSKIINARFDANPCVCFKLAGDADRDFDLFRLMRMTLSKSIQSHVIKVINIVFL